jgi:hypothetical protein
MIRTLSLLSLLPLAALVACGGKPDDSADTGDSTSTDCEITVDSTIPSSGSTDAYYRANIEFSLSDPDSTATITTTIAGTQVTSEDGLTVMWVLDGPMDPATPYTATLDYCGGTVDLSFTTSDLGTSMPEPTSLVGRTYVVALAEARIVEPPGIGSVLSSYLTTDILLGVSAVDGSSLDIMGAVAKSDVTPDEQDYCNPTIPFPTADFSAEPYFTVGPQTTTLSVAGYDIEIGDLNVTGTFAADGTYFDGGTLSGTIDTRPLSPLIDDSGDPGAICDLAINFGAECEACPADGEPYCLTLVADQILAEQVDGVTLLEVGGNNCMDCANPTDTTDLSETCEVDPAL